MPRSTRSSGKIPADEDPVGEEEIGGRRSTRRKAGGSEDEKKSPPSSPKKKKARRAHNDDAADSNSAKKPSDGASIHVIGLDDDDSAMKPSAARKADESTDPKLKVCLICKKNSTEDPRNMITFATLGTFHVFCGKIAAISSPAFPQLEIKEKRVIRQKSGQSLAVLHALDTCLSAVADDGKEFINLPDYIRRLEAARLALPDEAPSSSQASLVAPAATATAAAAASRAKSAKKKAPKKTTSSQSKRKYAHGVASSTSTGPSSSAFHGSEGLASLATAAGMKRGPEVRRRPCVCGHNDCYSVMERWLAVGDDKRCGYMSLPSWSAKAHTDRGASVNQFRELVFHNLLGEKALAVEDSTAKTSRKYVAYHHFEEYQLKPGNKGPVEYIEPDVATRHGLTEDYKIVSGQNRGKYVASPKRPWTDMMMELVGLETQRVGRFLPTSVSATSVSAGPPAATSAAAAAATTPSSSIVTRRSIIKLDNKELVDLNKRLQSAPKDYKALKARYDDAETALTKEKKRSSELEKELATIRMSMNLMQQNQMQMKGLVHKMFILSQKI